MYDFCIVLLALLIVVMAMAIIFDVFGVFWSKNLLLGNYEFLAIILFDTLVLFGYIIKFLYDKATINEFYN